MEPPFKRPRLSLYEAASISGDDLDLARRQNDMVLKNRWEAIFEKYSRDFSDIGDEVDVLTGRIVVNRGHLESMETETDPGQFDSKTFLRLLSAAQENGESYSYSGIGGVLPSIENMAEDAVGRLSADESENEDRRESSTRSRSSSSMSIVRDDGDQLHGADLEPYDSDRDSLFAHDEQDRESSVDSLFDETVRSFVRTDSRTSDLFQNGSRSKSAEMPDNDHIIAKFGPAVGQEVLELLEQRQQAHIEPAWRIPIAAEPVMVHKSEPRGPEVSARSVSPARNGVRSIWAVQATTATRSPSPPVQRVRYESEDPLQEDFIEKQPRHDDVYSSDGYVDDNKEAEVEEEENQTDPTVVARLVEASVSGTCTYCHRYFRDKSGVMAHWDRLLKKVDNLGDKDPHDCVAIRDVRSSVTRRVRLRRLTVGDFKTMVEFHEGAGLSFEEISKAKVLRTRKTGPQLQDIYDRHRTPRHQRETPEPLRIWPVEEDRVVLELSQNPLSTIATLRRGMKGRTELQIGNRLADIWLADLGRGSKAERSSACTASRPTHDVQFIKEESDDDLFH